MTVDVLEKRLSGRLDAAGLTLSAETVTVTKCVVYLRLLARWNGRINLTALPLSEPIPDRSLDKLLVEPLLAAQLFPSRLSSWVDLGSGGGSPAIPLRIARPLGTLTMVESRARKCAFLREVVRVLELERTLVRSERFEELPLGEDVDVVTLRAVRVDQELANVIGGLLKPGGSVVWFGAPTQTQLGLPLLRSLTLPDGSTASLFQKTNVPRGTSST